MNSNSTVHVQNTAIKEPIFLKTKKNRKTNLSINSNHNIFKRETLCDENIIH